MNETFTTPRTICIFVFINELVLDRELLFIDI